eukprot:1846546-Amphidinium_carterae.1
MGNYRHCCKEVQMPHGLYRSKQKKGATPSFSAKSHHKGTGYINGFAIGGRGKCFILTGIHHISTCKGAKQSAKKTPRQTDEFAPKQE